MENRKVGFVARRYGQSNRDSVWSGRTRRNLTLGTILVDRDGYEYEIVGVGFEGEKLVVTVGWSRMVERG